MLVTLFVFWSNLFAQKEPGEYSCSAGGQFQGHLYKLSKDGNAAPRVIRTVDPEYTEKARQAKIEGSVVLAIVVDPNGNPTRIRVSQGLESGLDEKAAEAVQQWKFQPGTLHGKPVAVAVCAQVDFHLPR